MKCKDKKKGKKSAGRSVHNYTRIAFGVADSLALLRCDSQA